MSNGTGDIVIKGGTSVDLDFDGVSYPSTGGRSHKNGRMKLLRIVVKDETGGIRYDSGEAPPVLKWEITATCKE